MSSWAAWGLTWGGSWGTSWGPLHEVEERPWDTAQGRAPQVHAVFHPIRAGKAQVDPVENRAYAVSITARGSCGAACLIDAYAAQVAVREVKVAVGRSGSAAVRSMEGATQGAHVVARGAASTTLLADRQDFLLAKASATGGATAVVSFGSAGLLMNEVSAYGVQNPTPEQLIAIIGAVRRGRLTRQAASGKRQPQHANR